MSASLNRVTLIGNLGRDPEVRYLPDGTATCTISLATTEQWKDKQTGEAKEQTDWHRVVFFKRQAEVVGEYLKKRSSIYVEGKLRTRSYQDKDGTDRYVTEVRAQLMKMLGSKPANDVPAAPAGDERIPVGDAADMDDDIPF